MLLLLYVIGKFFSVSCPCSFVLLVSWYDTSFIRLGTFYLFCWKYFLCLWLDLFLYSYYSSICSCHGSPDFLYVLYQKILFLYLKLFGVDESIYFIMSSVCHVSFLIFCLRVSTIWFLCKFLSILFLLYLSLGFFIDHFLICVLKLFSLCHSNLCICKSYSHYSLWSLNISIIAILKSLLCIWAI